MSEGRRPLMSGWQNLTWNRRKCSVIVICLRSLTLRHNSVCGVPNARLAADVSDDPINRRFGCSGFLSHLHSSVVTMSPKPSVTQSPQTGPGELTGDSLGRLPRRWLRGGRAERAAPRYRRPGAGRSAAGIRQSRGRLFAQLAGAGIPRPIGWPGRRGHTVEIPVVNFSLPTSLSTPGFARAFFSVPHRAPGAVACAPPRR